MISNNFYIRSINDRKLRKQGFRYHALDDIYTISFPLYKDGGYPVLYGKISIYGDTRNVLVDVFTENGNSYPQYYNQTNSAYDKILNIIHNNIYKKLNSYGIYERKTKIRKHKKNKQQ